MVAVKENGCLYNKDWDCHVREHLKMSDMREMIPRRNHGTEYLPRDMRFKSERGKQEGLARAVVIDTETALEILYRYCTLCPHRIKKDK